MVGGMVWGMMLFTCMWREHWKARLHNMLPQISLSLSLPVAIKPTVPFGGHNSNLNYIWMPWTWTVLSAQHLYLQGACWKHLQQEPAPFFHLGSPTTLSSQLVSDGRNSLSQQPILISLRVAPFNTFHKNNSCALLFSLKPNKTLYNLPITEEWK